MKIEKKRIPTLDAITEAKLRTCIFGLLLSIKSQYRQNELTPLSVKAEEIISDHLWYGIVVGWEYERLEKERETREILKGEL